MPRRLLSVVAASGVGKWLLPGGGRRWWSGVCSQVLLLGGFPSGCCLRCRQVVAQEAAAGGAAKWLLSGGLWWSPSGCSQVLLPSGCPSGCCKWCCRVVVQVVAASDAAKRLSKRLLPGGGRWWSTSGGSLQPGASAKWLPKVVGASGAAKWLPKWLLPVVLPSVAARFVSGGVC